jgi:N-acetylneuraminate synthase
MSDWADLTVEIEGRPIGAHHLPYVVAELSGNHNGDLRRALQLIDAAKEAGADAVKLQTYRADTITIDHSSPEFVIAEGLWGGRRLYDLYQEAHTPWEWHPALFEHARRIGIPIFSSPFDASAVDFLETLGAPAYKIASSELVDLPLIRRAARTGKPLIMSTGMADEEEIAEAVAAARGAGARELILLHCTAAYPAPVDEANLSTIAELGRRYGVVAGLSDHTLGITVATVAVGLGAAFIEKHFTLSRAQGGVDSAFSLEPAELAQLVTAAQVARVAVGTPTLSPTRSEEAVRRNRRSLYVVAGMAAGDVFSESNVRSIRPGRGLKPKYMEAVLGRRATCEIPFGTPLDASMVEGGLTDEPRP